MTKQPVQDYLRSHDDVGPGFFINSDLSYPGGYGVQLIGVIPLHPSEVRHISHTDFEPTELRVHINDAPAHLASGIDDWIDYELGKSVARKYDFIGAEVIEGSQFFVSTVLTKRDVDDLIAAVKKYDILSKSPEVEELREGLRNIVGEGIDRLL